MSRNTGTFNFAANFEVLAKAPLDAKQLVGTKADLTGATTWNQSGQVWLYDGAIVSVGSDPIAENNGIYFLSAATNYTDINSWVKAGTGEGGGTITGGTNGLSTAGTNIVLGGGDGLTGNTTINLNDHELQISTSGGTPTLLGVDETGILLSFSGGTGTGAAVTFEDNGGLKYGDDYSLNYTDRSLIDKAYADAIVSGLKPKAAVHVATTPADGNIVLSGLTTTIDGHVVTNGERVLIKNQTSGATNGIWITSAGDWTRATDFDGTPLGEVTTGSYMWVLSGDTNENTSWVLVTEEPITVGVTDLEFVYFNHVSDVSAGHGIIVQQSGTTHIITFDGGTIAGNSLSWTGTTGNETLNVNISTGTLSTALNSKLNVSLFEIYTGDTQPILDYAITGATNGLDAVGRNVELGGILTQATTISGGSFNLCLGDTGSPLAQFAVCAANANLEVSDYTLNATNCAEIIGGDFTIALSGNTGTISDSNSTGLKYGGDYSANYTCLSIPNVGFVTGATSAGQLYSGETPTAICVGGIDVGYDLTNKTFSCIIQDLFVPELYQTSVGTPSTPLSATLTGIREIGCSFSQTLTPNYNAGAITPLYCTDNGTTRGGAANNYSYTGPSVSTGFLGCTSCVINPYVVTTGSNTWSVCTRYNEGACVRGSKGTVNPTYPLVCALNSVTLAGSASITGILPWYYGTKASGTITGTDITTGCCAKVVASVAASTSICFDVTAPASEYLWFAAPTGAYTTKTKWWVCAANAGNIGGTGELWKKQAGTVAVTSAQGCWAGCSFDVYVTCGATSTATGIPMCLYY